MSERPFLLFVSRTDDGRPIVKVQGDGIPLTERLLTLDDCLRFVKHFNQAALDLVQQANLAKGPTGGGNS